MTKAVLGIMGGSGIYDLPGLEDRREEVISSDWGEPSSTLKRGRIGDTELVFLPRHGEGHRLSPSDINYHANIDVLKQAGVTDLVSLSACGSFRADLPPGSVVLVDQFIDRTVGRASSFFGAGCVAHVSMAHPVSPLLSARLGEAAKAEKIAVHHGGTYVCMEGPQFSSQAESLMYRAMGCDVIGMTAMPEAKLAREAEMCYALLALATDYDCWHQSEDDVSVEAVVAVLKANANLANAVVRSVATDLGQTASCACATAAQFAIMTKPELIPYETKAKLATLYGKYLSR